MQVLLSQVEEFDYLKTISQTKPVQFNKRQIASDTFSGKSIKTSYHRKTLQERHK
jgi:hypothetical protein